MNLTFNQNNKENSFLNSNYSNYNNNYTNKNSLKKIRLFPSIFSHFETESHQIDEILPIKKNTNIIKLPHYRNIREEIIKTRSQISSLFNIKNTIFWQMRTKNNSLCYQNFIKGFAKYFFGPNGIVTKRNKYLKEYYIHKIALNDRIYAGKLFYYDFSTSKHLNQVTARENENKKQRLSLSTNLAVVFGKNDVYSVKALTSKRLLNLKKNFVNINKSIYLSQNNNNLEPINEVPNNNKNNRNKLNQRKKIKIRLNTYTNNFFKKNNFSNKNKRKTFSFITEMQENLNNNKINNKQLHRSTIPKIKQNSYNIINNFNNNKKINRKSFLFSTHNNFNGFN